MTKSHKFSQFIAFCLADVCLFRFSENGKQKKRIFFIVVIVDYPDSTTFPGTISFPPELSDASRAFHDNPGGGVGGEIIDNVLSFTFIEQFP